MPGSTSCGLFMEVITAIYELGINGEWKINHCIMSVFTYIRCTAVRLRSSNPGKKPGCHLFDTLDRTDLDMVSKILETGLKTF